jgi:DNA-binding SARP family transcriptional activator
MEYRVLGPVEVLDESGRKLPLGGAMPQSVLASLLLRAGHTVALDLLVDELWEEPPATAARTVQAYVSRLRHALPEGAIESRAGGYRFVVDGDELDLEAFERRAEEGRAALDGGAYERAASLLREALALWRGPALAGLASEALRRQAERLEELRLSVLEDRLEADLGSARHGEVVPELQALVAEHPFRERFRAQLMRALYRSGRPGDALALYREGRVLLIEELGMEPGQELRELEQAILRQDTELEAPERTRALLPTAPSPAEPGPPVAQRRRSAVSSTSRTPTLDEFVFDLTQAAGVGKLDPVIGRADEIEQTIEILCRRMHNNPVLLGEPGVGKTAIVEEVARWIATGQVPETLAEKRLVALDFAAIAAASTSRREFGECLENVVREITRRGNIILFIDEFHNLVGTGVAEGAIDAASILKPALARGELQTIAITTLGNYRERMLSRDPTFGRCFEPVLVHEPTAEETIEILHGLKARYERYHHVRISDEGIVAAVEFADRYIDGFRPTKAIDLIDRASARLRLRAEANDDQTRGRPRRQGEPRVDAEHVAGLISREMGIPVSNITRWPQLGQGPL